MPKRIFICLAYSLFGVLLAGILYAKCLLSYNQQPITAIAITMLIFYVLISAVAFLEVVSFQLGKRSATAGDAKEKPVPSISVLHRFATLNLLDHYYSKTLELIWWAAPMVLALYLIWFAVGFFLLSVRSNSSTPAFAIAQPWVSVEKCLFGSSATAKRLVEAGNLNSASGTDTAVSCWCYSQAQELYRQSGGNDNKLALTLNEKLVHCLQEKGMSGRKDKTSDIRQKTSPSPGSNNSATLELNPKQQKAVFNFLSQVTADVINTRYRTHAGSLSVPRLRDDELNSSGIDALKRYLGMEPDRNWQQACAQDENPGSKARLLVDRILLSKGLENGMIVARVIGYAEIAQNGKPQIIERKPIDILYVVSRTSIADDDLRVVDFYDYRSSHD